MISGSEAIADLEAACLYVELISSSFNDEMNKRMMTILSLIGFGFKPVAIALSAYAVVSAEGDMQGAAGVFMRKRIHMGKIM